jgi:hypothetical protein
MCSGEKKENLMKHILYLLKYNTYHNRIVKGYDTLQEYLENETILYHTASVNFNPNDGVNTTHNLTCGDIDVDYLLCYNTDS